MNKFYSLSIELIFVYYKESCLTRNEMLLYTMMYRGRDNEKRCKMDTINIFCNGNYIISLIL